MQKEISDQIIFMEQGVIVEQGTPEELFSSENTRVREFIGKMKISKLRAEDFLNF